MPRSVGRFLDRLHNRVYLLSCTLDTLPLWSSFPVESRWSRPAGLARARHSPSLVHRPTRLPSGISAPPQFLHGSENLFQLHHLLGRIDQVVSHVHPIILSVAQNAPSTSTALGLSSLTVRRSWPDTWPPVLRTAVPRHSVAYRISAYPELIDVARFQFKPPPRVAFSFF
jgi:hypothetical protein